ncbi:hypothetical protein PDIG_44410 [Penicillium digitatum PHI26]|uniref:Uncharacterized protein n=2 Tax=Penicillium digitatum TaxID=36651 RepID=K9FVH2_PEND2|nr:hypothetical protein PDIP_35650 [Penicillium digitatum Pd1]EKV12517.1 hypothetical protein PDIG_44410 [Penicillium digitatum PHI26]EKV16454.1 hypothetical protein PDIP_35650 [Penicillium digitatum Pd1]
MQENELYFWHVAFLFVYFCFVPLFVYSYRSIHLFCSFILYCCRSSSLSISIFAPIDQIAANSPSSTILTGRMACTESTKSLPDTIQRHYSTGAAEIVRS